MRKSKKNRCREGRAGIAQRFGAEPVFLLGSRPTGRSYGRSSIVARILAPRCAAAGGQTTHPGYGSIVERA